METHDTAVASLEKRARDTLSRVNDRNVAGSDLELVSPILAEVSDEELARWVEEQLQRPEVPSLLKELETEQLSKLGPRSIQIPWSDRKESLAAYFRHESFDVERLVWSPDWPKGLRPLGVEETAKRLDRTKSSGLPYMRTKGAVLSEHSLAAISSTAGEYPCVLFTRTQEQGKTRNVWGFPMGDTLHEQAFFRPFFDTIEAKAWLRAAVRGPDAVDVALNDLLASVGPGDGVVSVDFSGFDASIHPDWSRHIFGLVGASFRPEFHDEIGAMGERFATIPILTPDGEWSGAHGVPSGSSWTNTVDSIAQFMASEFHHLQANGQRNCQIQGDDGVYVVPAGQEEALLDRFRKYGLRPNAEKTKIFSAADGAALYLQHLHLRGWKSPFGSGGIYPIARALNRIKHPERFVDFTKEPDLEAKDYWNLRTLMILENCKHHPSFEALVDFVAKRADKSLLDFSAKSIPAFSNKQMGQSSAQVRRQHDVTGIGRFAVIKVLQGLGSSKVTLPSEPSNL